MKHIFISHAGQDSEIAKKLHNDLRNAGHESIIDIHELNTGNDLIAFINDGINNAYTVVILFSKHTLNAAWQKLEIDSAVWSEIEQQGGQCIVIKLDDTDLPPTLGPKVFRKINEDLSNYDKVFNDLCEAVLASQTSSSIVADAFRKDLPNPFRRVRAEFFEDLPKDLVESFSPPDAMKMGALEEMQPCFLEGPRGTGKSMLLLSLRARNLAIRREAKIKINQIFGFYLKLNRGAICNIGIADDQSSDPRYHIEKEKIVQFTENFSQEIIICLLESLFAEIAFCIDENHISCDRANEKALVERVYIILSGENTSGPSNSEGLMEFMMGIHRKLSDFMRKKYIYRENVSIPIATLDLNIFKQILKCVKDFLSDLSNSHFVILLDEYENLYPFQQRVINGFVKLAAPEFSVKIAKKLGTAESSGTTTGQELQEIHDYNRVNLVYDVGDSQQFSAYRELLEHITKKILKNHGLKYDSINSLLPVETSLEVDENRLNKEIAKFCKLPLENFNSLPSDERSKKISHYKEASIYRVLYGGRGRRKEKRFCGFHDMAFLSSGIIRYYQEFLGVAFHLQYEGGTGGTKTISFSHDKQTKAVYIVSQHNLTTLSKNVELYGERLKYYILDIGDCLRHKLIYHTSEPEAARLTIIDPELLNEDKNEELKKVIVLGIREGVFQTTEGRPAFKPKHGTDPQPIELNICRLYAPILQISPRLRWRTNVYCSDLLNLWMPYSRKKAKKKLMDKIVKVEQKDHLELPFNKRNKP